MTNEQVDTIKDKLRQAQNLLEEAGAIISDTGDIAAKHLWNRITSHANDVGDTIDSGVWEQVQ